MSQLRSRSTLTGLRVGLLLLWVFAPAGPAAGSGWSDPEIVPGSRDLVVDVPSLARDRLGQVWMLVDAHPPFEDPRHAYAAFLDGGVWSTFSPVDTSGTSRVEDIDVAYDSGNIRWTVWRNGDDGNIWYRRGADAEAQLLFGSLAIDCHGPAIAAGSTGPWCCWYGRTYNGYYQVYVSRWNGVTWGIQNTLNIRLLGTDHLLCDIALDDAGNPHVVWLDSSAHAIRYSDHSSTGWSFPVSTHDPLGVRAIPSGSPRIRVDDFGRPHVVWIGTRPLPFDLFSNPGVFYQVRTEGKWSTPLQLNLDPSYHAALPDLAIVEGEAWAAWHGEQGDWPIFTAAYATKIIPTPRPETRIDDNRISRNEAVRIIPTDAGPLVAWFGRGGTLARAVISRRFLSDPEPSFGSLRARAELDRVVLTWEGDGTVFQRFEIDRRQGSAVWARVGTVRSAPGTGQSWIDTQPPPARYTYRVRGFLGSGDAQMLGPVTVDATGLPDRFELQLYLNPARDTADLLIGSAGPGSLELRAYDIQGKVVGEAYHQEVGQGWHRVPMSILLRRGTVSGVYFVRASLDGGRRHLKVFVR